MPVREFEMFHGAVLTKIVHSDHPMTLRLIETKKGAPWAAYKINDEVMLYIKYSTRQQTRKREGNAAGWTFVFARDELDRLRKLQQTDVKNGQLYFVFVCGSEQTNNEQMEVCLVSPDQIARLVDFKATNAQNVTVLRHAGKSLRIYGPGRLNSRDELIIPRNRLDEWRVPGS